MESNKVLCKACNQLKTKTESGFYPGKNRTKKYVDEFGLIWNGRTCPQCNRDRSKKSMKASRTLNTNLNKLLKIK